MARKTNKTNHVLGLLAGKNEETEESKTVAGEKTAALGESMEGASAASNVQIVAKQEEDDMIADTVNQLLEEELEAEEDALSKEAGTAAKEAEIKSYKQDATEDLAAQETAEGEAEDMQEISSEAQLSEESQRELERLEKEGNAAATEDDYVFLNVMETLVNETVGKWMQQFGTCTCSRCRADVVALSLTNLPSKYVVVGRNAVAPLMNFYSQQYSGAITVEVTKACTKVMEHPHHNRD